MDGRLPDIANECLLWLVCPAIYRTSCGKAKMVACLKDKLSDRVYLGWAILSHGHFFATGRYWLASIEPPLHLEQLEL